MAEVSETKRNKKTKSYSVRVSERPNGKNESGGNRKKKNEKNNRSTLIYDLFPGRRCRAIRYSLQRAESNLVALNSPDNHNKIIGYGAWYKVCVCVCVMTLVCLPYIYSHLRGVVLRRRMCVYIIYIIYDIREFSGSWRIYNIIR